GAEVHGLARRATWPPGLSHLADRVRLHAGDLTERTGVETILRDVRPEQVYHLAGYAQTGNSFREPEAAWAGNLGGTRALFDAIATWGGSPRILAVTRGVSDGANPRADVPAHALAPLR